MDIGEWYKDGCCNTTNNKIEVLYECNHLTNFAILLVGVKNYNFINYHYDII